MKLTQRELDCIEELKNIIKELTPLKNKWQEAQFELDNWTRRLYEQEKESRYWSAVDKCSYKEPYYPSMGVEGSNGYATFNDFKDAESLISANIETYGYGKTFVLEWNGPGNYVVEPEYGYDHDGDVVYTATFRKLK